MPPLEPDQLLQSASEIVRGTHPNALIDAVVFRDEVTLVVGKTWIVPILKALRAHERLAFDMLIDITAIDYLEMNREPRFDVVYHLFSLRRHHRIRLRAPVAEQEVERRIESICGLWSGANFQEREVFDMFGIRFDGHPDLRRILMPDDWEGYPLRKDFPLGGSKSFYYKQETNEYAGEPNDLVPRIRVQDSDV